jgi:hypothetical protein
MRKAEKWEVGGGSGKAEMGSGKRYGGGAQECVYANCQLLSVLLCQLPTLVNDAGLNEPISNQQTTLDKSAACP